MAQLWHHFDTIASFSGSLWHLYSSDMVPSKRQEWCRGTTSYNLAPGPACRWSLPGAVYTEQDEWPVCLSRGDEDDTAAGDPAEKALSQASDRTYWLLTGALANFYGCL